jgi:hypothetical protein
MRIARGGRDLGGLARHRQNVDDEADRADGAGRADRAFVPKPEDFTTVIRPLRRTCGLNIRPALVLADQRIAHCTITYRTAVRYRGKALDPGVTYGVVSGSWNRERQRDLLVLDPRHARDGLPVRTAVPSPGVTLAAVANDVERAR